MTTEERTLMVRIFEWLDIIGIAIAVTISYGLNKSIAWAAIHGILSWFYIAYYALVLAPGAK